MIKHLHVVLPILYSYRRCPYAMRARMALKLAGIEVEIREISLRDKPAHMLQLSAKGSVPVLVLQDSSVIDESLAIMEYALQPSNNAASKAIILQNDTRFKQALDAYKYPERHPEKSQIQHRQQGEVFLQQLESLLQINLYLFAAKPSFADYAIFPFVRQFAAVDSAWWESSTYKQLRIWLTNLIESDLFLSVMQKQPAYSN